MQIPPGRHYEIIQTLRCSPDQSRHDRDQKFDRREYDPKFTCFGAREDVGRAPNREDLMARHLVSLTLAALLVLGCGGSSGDHPNVGGTAGSGQAGASTN